MRFVRCRVCRERPAVKPGKKCRACYRPSKFARRGLGNGYASRPLPKLPTCYPPGGVGKVLVMCDRARRGEQLFHPLDAQHHGDERPLLYLSRRSA